MDLFLTRGPPCYADAGLGHPDLAAEEPSIYGTLISSSAYGHTGFTGTELWIDPPTISSSCS
jgi:hypothetical protein